MANPNGINGTNGHSKYSDVAPDVIELYKQGDPIKDIVDAQTHASIDGKRAKQLLSEAYTMLDKVARQKAININDANFICGAIHDFFVANGWKLK